MVLLFAVRTIDSAAKRISVPEFEVSFENLIKRLKCKSKEKKEITFCITNKGEDIAEDLHIFFCFPPSFEVHKGFPYSVFKQGIETDIPDYNAAIFHQDLVHIDTIIYFRVIITTPEKKDIYGIPITIYERKTGEHKDELEVEIL